MSDAYAAAGVDRTKVASFKRAMSEAMRRTWEFPAKRGVDVTEHSIRYLGSIRDVSFTPPITEGLGRKNAIAEAMYKAVRDPRWFAGIGVDTAMMSVVDCIRRGALPVAFRDKIVVQTYDWFTDEIRSTAIIESFCEACRIAGMALTGGESAAAPDTLLPAPDFSGAVVGIFAPASREIRGSQMRRGAEILGVTSSGLHANGSTLVMGRAKTLADGFFTPIPNPSPENRSGTFGEEALIPTRSYVALVEALQRAGVEILEIVPVTGGGVSKLAEHPRRVTYRITKWVDVPPIFQFMRSLDVSVADCLTAFNWGIGLFLLIPEHSADRAMAIGRRTEYEIHRLGRVESGERKVIFEPERLELTPLG